MFLSIYIFKRDQSGGIPGVLFSSQDKTIETSSNSGRSLGKILTRPAVNNQQLACTQQGEQITEESLRFDRALESLGESMHPTKDKVLAKEMATYGRQKDGATRYPTHLDLAPPPVVLGKGTTDWLSQLAVRSTLRLKKVELPGGYSHKGKIETGPQ